MNASDVSSISTVLLDRSIPQQTPQDFTLALPEEILVTIFEHLTYLQLNIVSQACRRWRLVATNNDIMLHVFHSMIKKLQEDIIPSFIINNLNKQFAFFLSKRITIATGKWAHHPMTKQIQFFLQTPSIDPDKECWHPDMILYARKQSLLPTSTSPFNLSLNFELEVQNSSLLKKRVRVVEEAIRRINALTQHQQFAPDTQEVLRLFWSVRHRKRNRIKK